MRKVTLYINYYTSILPRRQKELDECLQRNDSSPQISRIIALTNETVFPKTTKVTWIRGDYSKNKYNRPTLQDYFNAVNQHVSSPYEISIVANADLFFNETLDPILDYNFYDTCFALTRWEHETPIRMGKSNNSQDAWVFQGHIRPLGWGTANYSLGIFGCDNRLAWELKTAGYHVINPCLDVKVMHIHGSRIRNNGSDVGGPKATINHTYLSNFKFRSLIGPLPGGIISFSLYGESKRYTYGAIENAKMARDIYPEWVIRFYVDESVPSEILESLDKEKAEIVKMPKNGFGLFWRFLATDDQGFSRWLIRDCDSRLTYRERRAVDEWIASGLPYHVMRDHPHHIKAIMGGTFGGLTCNSIIKNLGTWMMKHAAKSYDSDQRFLAANVWPLIKSQCLIHDSFSTELNIKRFPTPFENYRFVGERWHWTTNNLWQIDHADRFALLRKLNELQNSKSS